MHHPPVPGEIPYLQDGPVDATRTLILAHGAGAPMDSTFMQSFAEGIGLHGIRVVRFEFSYMRARRDSGSRRPPDREPVLLEAWRQAYRQLSAGQTWIGGKSMGGRMASLVADELGVAGLVCLGFPFHAPGKPPGARIAHLATLASPALIVQGTRDPFGPLADVSGYDLSDTIALHWIQDGDHDLVPRKASGRTLEQNWAEGIAAAAHFILA